MNLSERIDNDLIAAIKSNDDTRRDTLRYLKSSLKNYQIEQHKNELTDDDISAIISREIKKRKESIEAYRQAGKAQLTTDEQKELEILKSYQPEQLSNEQVNQIVETYLQSHQGESLQIGQVIGALSPQLKGRADMSLVAQLIKDKLG